MKRILFLIVVMSVISTSFANAYTGCRQLRDEYSWLAFEDYGVNVGDKSIWLKLSCTSDCWNLMVGGDYSGNATQCGTTNPDTGYDNWSYSGCGSSPKFIQGDTNDAINAVLQDCQR